MQTGLAIAERITIGRRVRAVDLHLLGTVVEIAPFSDVMRVRLDNGIERWWSSVLLLPIADNDQRNRA